MAIVRIAIFVVALLNIRKVSSECPDGIYGENCLQVCGKCKIGVCDKRFGNCTNNECKQGYQGSLCQIECTMTKFGYDCRPICGHCKDGHMCSKINGTCPNGKCSAGYKGALCKTQCSDGEYGENCKEACGNCKIGFCDKMLGNCTNDECAVGYNGFLCKTAQQQDDSDTDIASVAAGVIVGAFVIVILVFLAVQMYRSRYSRSPKYV